MKLIEFLLEIRDPDRIHTILSGRGFCAYWDLDGKPHVGISTDETGENIVTIQIKGGRRYRTDAEIRIFISSIANLLNMKRE